MERLKHLTPMLQTMDMQKTIEFYARVLDFKVVGSWPEANPIWCMLERDGARVMFMTNDHLPEPRMTGTLYVETTDVMAIYNRIAGQVEIQWGPEIYEYGMHEFAIKDCNGYTISFGQPVGPEIDRKPEEDPARDP